MRVISLTADGYRNLSVPELRPEEGVNILYGDNAQGKTNLLEAVWLFTGGRSFRGAKDRELVGIDEAAENAHILEASKKLWGSLNHREY